MFLFLFCIYFCNVFECIYFLFFFFIVFGEIQNAHRKKRVCYFFLLIKNFANNLQNYCVRLFICSIYIYTYRFVFFVKGIGEFSIYRVVFSFKRVFTIYFAFNHVLPCCISYIPIKVIITSHQSFSLFSCIIILSGGIIDEVYIHYSSDTGVTISNLLIHVFRDFME